MAAVCRLLRRWEAVGCGAAEIAATHRAFSRRARRGGGKPAEGRGPWVYPVHPGMEAPAEANAAELAAAERVFGVGGSFEGTQADAVFFAPLPEQVEVALLGRSNAGKSSLLNALLGAGGASTSATPGHTDALHFWRLGRTALHLVDLPGYGYAHQRDAGVRDAWMRLIAGYLHARGRDGGGILQRVLLLVDVRRGLRALDREAIELMAYYAIPYHVVLTKADTLASPPGALEAAVAMAVAEVGRGHLAFPNLNVVSSLTGAGLPDLRASLAMAASLPRVAGVAAR